MSTNTTYFNLIKPEKTDTADITAYNSNWDVIDEQLAFGSDKLVYASSSDGITYTATAEGVTKLYPGLTVIFIPNKTSTNNAPTFNLNGLGAVRIIQPLTTNSGSTVLPSTATWLVADYPVSLQYDGKFWRTVSMPRVSANHLYGTVPITAGGTGATTRSVARSNLGIGTTQLWTGAGNASVTITNGWSGDYQMYLFVVSGLLVGDGDGFHHTVTIPKAEIARIKNLNNTWSQGKYATYFCNYHGDTVALSVEASGSDLVVTIVGGEETYEGYGITAVYGIN